MPDRRTGRSRLGRLAPLLLAFGGALLVLTVVLAIVRPERRQESAPATTAPPATTTPPPATTAPGPPATTAPTTAPPATTTPPAATTAPPPTTTAPAPTTTTAPGGLAVVNPHVVSATPVSATVAWETTAPARSRASWGASGRPLVLFSDAGAEGVAHEAVVAALAPDTSYTVGIDAWRGDERAHAELTLTTPRADAGSTASVAGGALLLDGQPFFPLMAFAQCPDRFPASLAAGLRLFLNDPCNGLAGAVQALEGRAFAGGGENEATLTGAGVIGWYYPDEADGLGLTAATLPEPPSGVPPGRVSFLTLSNHFYSKAAPLAQGNPDYAALVARADVVGFDLYPLQGWCQGNRFADVAAAQRELVGLAGEKPTFQWIEARTMECPQPELAVTPATVRAESWLAIAGGAHGLGFFPPDWDERIGGAIAGVGAQVASISAALLQPELPVGTEDAGSVVATARSYGGALYVVAVNPTRTRVRAVLHLPQLESRRLIVLDERRSVAAGAGTLTDTFGPLAVHLYVAPPSA